MREPNCTKFGGGGCSVITLLHIVLDFRYLAPFRMRMAQRRVGSKIEAKLRISAPLKIKGGVGEMSEWENRFDRTNLWYTFDWRPRLTVHITVGVWASDRRLSVQPAVGKGLQQRWRSSGSLHQDARSSAEAHRQRRQALAGLLQRSGYWPIDLSFAIG